MDHAIVTGTNKGIGFEITRNLLINNYRVYGISRKNTIHNNNFEFLPTDLSSANDVEQIIFPIINKNNKIILINNAGTIGSIKPISKKSANDIISEYNINIIAPTLLIKKFIKKYPHNDKLIINISSGAANYPIESWSTYCAAKSALDMISNVVQKETHEKLRCISVHPGKVDTDMQKEIRSAEPALFPSVKTFSDYHKNNELSSPEVVAKKIYHIICNIDKIRENVLHVDNISLN